MWRHLCSTLGVLLLAVAVFVGGAPLVAQQTSSSSRTAPAGALQQGIYLVFPFENAGASPRLDWIGEGLEELTIQRLSAAGQQVYSHAGRLNELDRYGLPPSAKFSRATMLHVAEDLDADFVVFGSFTSDGKTLSVEVRILHVDPVALLPPVRESGLLDSFMDLHTRLMWRLLSTNGQAHPVSLAEFSKAQQPHRLDAFEQYIRGLLTNDDETRLRNLREAARLEPDWPDPDLALGQAYFSRNDCNSALVWFARVPRAYERSVEAVFAIGVCRLLLHEPDRAEEVFTSLQETLRQNGKNGSADPPEILNNLAIARARQGKTPAAQADLRRASDFDPDEDDYPFNLGLIALRAGDFSAAAGYFREASQREPDNPEDRALLIQSLEKAGEQAEADQEREAASEALGPNALPSIRLDAKGEALVRLERVKTELDTTSLRLEIESSQSSTAASAASSAADTPTSRVRRGRQELAAGRIDTAESEFRTALVSDPSDAAAHRGLAEIDRRRGHLDDAVKELQASLASRDSAAVRTMLARIYLEQKKPDLARAEVERAIKLAPNYAEAKLLLEHLQNTKPAGGAQ